MYTEKELKEATQIAYLSFLSQAKESLKADGNKGPFTIRELIKSCINVQSAFDLAIADGVPKEKITLHKLVEYSDLKKSDKSIIERLSKYMLDWKIIHIQDLNSFNGFYACCIETSEKEAIVAFRGSESMRDFSNAFHDWGQADIALVNSRSTRQQEEAEHYADFLLKNGLLERYESIAVTGHSLGGNLATHFTISTATEERKKIFDKIDQSVNFDGPGVSGEYLEEHNEKIEKAASKISHLKWSPVGSLLFDIPGEKCEFLGTKKLESNRLIDKIKYKFTRHDTKRLIFDENGRAQRGKQDEFSRKLGKFSRAIDDFIPESITTEIAAATDWIFERILRIKEGRALEFNDVSWAERFCKQGSIIGTCVNFVNKAVDIFKEGALALQNEIGEFFNPTIPQLTPKLALADVDGAISANYRGFNISYQNSARNVFGRENNIDREY